MLKTKMENNEYFNLVSQYLQNEEELMIGSAGILAFLDELPSSSCSESSSSSEESEREETSKCQNFCEVIDGYGGNEFKSHMTVEFLIVVDADKRFVDVTCGEPGSLHDSRVLRRSHLGETLVYYPRLWGIKWAWLERGGSPD
ncbi:uncharacterized protein LOC128921931 isoform X2 [Zeugodacus cucurbitae]|uniref:uncharacterized protein LOC128921931 isoform X2 n=1 Tax=Zeugodacus cucurbitae TaxID=28588 RepID=UPI0023D9148A|nr:uncharacterized protein LOC128921931 isoform X2 [Zeugodacus cucurbitae]